jgi:hypothetical protein
MPVSWACVCSQLLLQLSITRLELADLLWFPLLSMLLRLDAIALRSQLVPLLLHLTDALSEPAEGLSSAPPTVSTCCFWVVLVASTKASNRAH